MILIADSGSTKTDWCFLDVDSQTVVSTQGINPYLQTSEDIDRILCMELKPSNCDVSKIYFYGAGCTQEKGQIVGDSLGKIFPTAQVEVNSDLLAAARALFGRDEGIACILGTGSNSCFYDGNKISDQVSPLGFILGDEGSAAYIGKRLVGNCLKHQFGEDVCRMFLEEVNLTPAEIINNVYRQPMPNRFLGGISQFCQRHLDIEEIREFIVDCFLEFFKRNIDVYSRKSEIGFVGSIACVYKSELEAAAELRGYKVGKILKAPLAELVKFHIQWG